VFIISFNQLTIDFWEQHLNLKNIQLFHWINPEDGINNLSTVWPDVVIIDGYFSKTTYEPCLRKVLKLKFNQKIFCLTPIPRPIDTPVFIDERLVISKLDEKVINAINRAINSTEKVQLKQSA
jgi:hypothetical protein